MRIKKLIIYNFRSYYGMKLFNFSEHLNLILGSNGDGKSTFFDALNWVLTPDASARLLHEDTLPSSALISAKMFKELSPKQVGKVLVSVEIEYETNISKQSLLIERSFCVTKSNDDTPVVTDHHHDAYACSAGRKGKYISSAHEALETKEIFPATIKRYQMFKGEEKLNLFGSGGAKTLDDLINLFADIKDVVPFKLFAEFATKEADKETERVRRSNNEAIRKIHKVKEEISRLESDISRQKEILNSANTEYDEMDANIEAYSDDMRSISRISELQKEIEELERDIDGFRDRIDESYGFKLLDDRWILMGFQSILEEYRNKMESNKTIKVNMEKEYEKKQEDEFEKEKAEKATTELEKIIWKMSDVENMKYMLSTHRCAICGSSLDEGTKEYAHIKQRIQDVIELLRPKPSAPKLVYKQLFKGSEIDQMHRLAEDLLSSRYVNYVDIGHLPTDIKDQYELNEELRKQVALCDEQIGRAKAEIVELNAKSLSGLDLVDLTDKLPKINEWMKRKESSGYKIKHITEVVLPDLKRKLDSRNKELSKLAGQSGAASIFMVSQFFNLLGQALNNAEQDSYQELLDKLNMYSNEYLAMLNVDDFTGVINIDATGKGPKIHFIDKNGQEITNPNTSLFTTVNISILLAISELTKHQRETDYPLVFDAPTSSFDHGKDKSFYQFLNEKIDKQCIVVTKSFLYKDDATDKYIVDTEALNKIQCRKYRIQKLSGFDKQDLTTIDTQLEEL